jgi:hypothetical protein
MEKEPDKRPLNADMVAEALGKIKEKVAAQKSAGIEAVTKRRIDRTPADLKLDEEDKDIARVMVGKKKKKKKAQPFYTRGWFTLTALGGLLLFMGGFLFYVFFVPPSAESLYRQAESLMKSGSKEDQLAARDGPLADFLRYHPEHEKKAQIQEWADQIDFEIRDRQMHNGRNRSSKIEGPDAREEQLARDALDDEDLGNLAGAAGRWDELSKRKGNSDPDLHKWGLVGERYKQEIKNVDALYHQLWFKIKEERNLEKPTVPGDDLERLGLDALREEMAKHLPQAKNHWDDLKSKAGNRRRWYLLAAKRSRELRDEIETQKK